MPRNSAKKREFGTDSFHTTNIKGLKDFVNTNQLDVVDILLIGNYLTIFYYKPLK